MSLQKSNISIYAYIKVSGNNHLGYVINIRNQNLLLRFGNRLLEVRKEKGISQEKLANMADITISQVSRIERGEVNTTISTVEVLSKSLDVSRSVLMDF